MSIYLCSVYFFSVFISFDSSLCLLHISSNFLKFHFLFVEIVHTKKRFEFVHIFYQFVYYSFSFKQQKNEIKFTTTTKQMLIFFHFHFHFHFACIDFIIFVIRWCVISVSIEHSARVACISTFYS